MSKINDKNPHADQFKGTKCKVEDLLIARNFSTICRLNSIKDWETALKHPENKILLKKGRYKYDDNDIQLNRGDEVYISTSKEMKMLGEENATPDFHHNFVR